MAVGDVSVSLTNADARQCAKFDGVDDYVDVGNAASLNITNTITVTAWVKDNNNNLDKIIAGRFSAGDNKRAWRIGNGHIGLGHIAVVVCSDGGSTNRKWYDSSLNFVTNSWNFVVFTFNGTDLKLYTNAVLDTNPFKNNDAAISSIFDNGLKTYIGADNAVGTPADFWNGSIGEVRIYNRALSAEEVAKLYGGENITKGLVGYWPLKDDYNDYSGEGNHGTNTGSILGTFDGPVSKAVADARVNASDRYFAIDVNGGKQILSGRIQEA